MLHLYPHCCRANVWFGGTGGNRASGQDTFETPLMFLHVWVSAAWSYPLKSHLFCQFIFQFGSVQLLSHVHLFATPRVAARQASLSITNSQILPKLMSHRVGDAIQPSHPLSSPSPPAPNPSQFQGIFQGVSSSHEVAKVLEFQPQHQSFQWTPRTGLL